MVAVIEKEPCYIFHSFKYQEHSLILKVLSLNYGPLSILMRNNPRQSIRGVFQPYTPLLLSMRKSMRSELYYLTDYSVGNGGYKFSPPDIFCAAYVNELLGYLYQSKDPDQRLFMVYVSTLDAIRDKKDINHALRLFELRLFHSLGYALSPYDDHGEKLKLNETYRFCFGVGFVRFEPQWALQVESAKARFQRQLRGVSEDHSAKNQQEQSKDDGLAAELNCSAIQGQAFSLLSAAKSDSTASSKAATDAAMLDQDLSANAAAHNIASVSKDSQDTKGDGAKSAQEVSSTAINSANSVAKMVGMEESTSLAPSSPNELSVPSTMDGIANSTAQDQNQAQSKAQSVFSQSSEATPAIVGDDSGDGLMFSKAKVKGRRLESKGQNAHMGYESKGFMGFNPQAVGDSAVSKQLSEYAGDFLGPVLSGAEIVDILSHKFALPQSLNNAKLLCGAVIERLLNGRELHSKSLYKDYMRVMRQAATEKALAQHGVAAPPLQPTSPSVQAPVEILPSGVPQAYTRRRAAPQVSIIDTYQPLRGINFGDEVRDIKPNTKPPVSMSVAFIERHMTDSLEFQKLKTSLGQEQAAPIAVVSTPSFGIPTTKESQLNQDVASATSEAADSGDSIENQIQPLGKDSALPTGESEADGSEDNVADSVADSLVDKANETKSVTNLIDSESSSELGVAPPDAAQVADDSNAFEDYINSIEVDIDSVADVNLALQEPSVQAPEAELNDIPAKPESNSKASTDSQDDMSKTEPVQHQEYVQEHTQDSGIAGSKSHGARSKTIVVAKASTTKAKTTNPRAKEEKAKDSEELGVETKAAFKAKDTKSKSKAKASKAGDSSDSSLGSKDGDEAKALGKDSNAKEIVSDGDSKADIDIKASAEADGEYASQELSVQLASSSDTAKVKEPKATQARSTQAKSTKIKSTNLKSTKAKASAKTAREADSDLGAGDYVESFSHDLKAESSVSKLTSQEAHIGDNLVLDSSKLSSDSASLQHVLTAVTSVMSEDFFGEGLDILSGQALEDKGDSKGASTIKGDLPKASKSKDRHKKVGAKGAEDTDSFGLLGVIESAKPKRSRRKPKA